MQIQIRNIDDSTAIRTDTIAQSRMRNGKYETRMNPETAQALENGLLMHLRCRKNPIPAIRSGRLLLLLAEMPEYQTPLSAIPPARQ
ncbi:MAG: hypothetical protein R2941_24815 [Desulfobacterales bacterium]